MIAMQYSFTLPAQATPREVKTDQDRRRCGRQTVVERDGFEPEVSLAVLPTAQSETPVPPKSATEILAQETGARSPCAAPKAAGRCCADCFSSIFRTSPQRRRRESR